MEYYVESREIPMYNLLKIFETNNYNWLIIEYSDFNDKNNFTSKVGNEILERHFINILGELNNLGLEIWLLIIQYCGIIHKIKHNKSVSSPFQLDLKQKGLEIKKLLDEENKKIELLLNHKINMKEHSLLDWLVLRENTI